MKITKKSKPRDYMLARRIPQGAVYTWGVAEQFYLSTQAGSVCLNSGVQLALSNPMHEAHFDQQVFIVEATLHVET